jgi:hypothetical protein
LVETCALSPNITRPSARKPGEVSLEYNFDRINEIKSDADAG